MVNIFVCVTCTRKTKKSYNFLEKLDVEWENLDAAVELQ